jgi:hypothetical protein
MPDRNIVVPDDRDDRPTLIAIAILAFILADIVHEVIGHGLAYIAVGGRSFVMTTTLLIGQGPHVDASGRLFVGVDHGELYGNIVSLGGPLGGLVCAGLCWLALRSPRLSGARLRLFLWLGMAFNLFWEFGYLISSGATNTGDWIEPFRGIPPPWLWRCVLIVSGILLYRLSMIVLAREVARFIDVDEAGSRRRLRNLVWISYCAAGVIACAATVFDPRGADQVYKSGAPSSFVAALGLLAMPGLLRRIPRRSETPPGGITITRSLGWILVAALASGIYVGVLGPGLRVSLAEEQRAVGSARIFPMHRQP